MAGCIRNIRTKSHENLIVFVQVRIENVWDVFFETQRKCMLPGKAVPEMTYTVSSGTLNPTHSLAQFEQFLPQIL